MCLTMFDSHMVGETPGVEDEYMLMTHVYNIGEHRNRKIHSRCFDSVVNITWK
jgi:hypothetical protein